MAWEGVLKHLRPPGSAADVESTERTKACYVFVLNTCVCVVSLQIASFAYPTLARLRDLADKSLASHTWFDCVGVTAKRQQPVSVVIEILHDKFI